MIKPNLNLYTLKLNLAVIEFSIFLIFDNYPQITLKKVNIKNNII